jgi:3-hydroxyisobutyrate dehydrogenase-like beta-hydroxyacid dehydrogenase
MQIAFLGLGMMGSRMAANLVRAGYHLTVWNRTIERAEGFVADHPGTRLALTPREAAEDADILFSMVVDGRQVHELLLGRDGAVDGARPSTLFVDCSTIGPEYARSIGIGLRDRGFAFLDAPVTGSWPRAEAGTLVFMVGGERAEFERVKPVLDVMGTLTVYSGASGQGQVIKVINNAVSAVNTVVVGEALLTAECQGADLDALVEVMGAGSGGSMMLELKAGPMRKHDYTPLFRLDHMLKDVRLCLEAADAAGIEFGYAREADEVLGRASAMGHGNDDFSALIEVLEVDADMRLDE